MSPPASGLVARWSALDASYKRGWLKACVKLAGARYELARQPVSAILTRLSSPPSLSAASGDDCRLISWAIGSAGARVPWRSDCLIQAMASAAWLHELGHGWTLNIGLRRGPGGALEAHAWLASGEAIISGNLPDLESFRPIPLKDLARSGASFPGG